MADDATTTFAYTPFGAIERVTQPDGAFLQYGYDQAQDGASVRSAERSISAPAL